MKRWVLLFLCGVQAALAETPLPRPVTDGDYRRVDIGEAKIGQLLFYDRVLSGNRNIACSTCHNPRDATGDGLSLGLGEGAVGIGHDRRVSGNGLPSERVARNTPPLFNLGANEFVTLFHDGRVAVDVSRPSGIRTPLPDVATRGFASVLAAQTMFPMLSPVEMAGRGTENEIASAISDGIITGQDGALDLVARRVNAIAGYRNLFAAQDPDIRRGRAIRFADIANALAAFVATEWRADQSPFDAYLRGEGSLSPQQALGAQLFYGKGGCATCHSGPFQTDHRFHAVGQPQLGPGHPQPGEAEGRDDGRMLVTKEAKDVFAFRTPSLRNVIVTGPWGHAGAYSSLTAFLRQHIAPSTGMKGYVQQAVLPHMAVTVDDWKVLHSPIESERIAQAVDMADIILSPAEIKAVITFLDSLTDVQALAGRLGQPTEVPSGEAVDIP